MSNSKTPIFRTIDKQFLTDNSDDSYGSSISELPAYSKPLLCHCYRCDKYYVNRTYFRKHLNSIKHLFKKVHHQLIQHDYLEDNILVTTESEQQNQKGLAQSHKRNREQQLQGPTPTKKAKITSFQNKINIPMTKDQIQQINNNIQKVNPATGLMMHEYHYTNHHQQYEMFNKTQQFIKSMRSRLKK